ncbi:LysR family transcriptional regulator [Rathayibacter oskolensis]|uniref:LysR family transcriptional regulator n=1 Tax=Rathayibacter oskolensis TaxID=1891671 RepID=UPI003F5D507E
MDDRQLAAFVAVSEELNFTRAAARLYVVQSTLSASIRALEHELGAPLFTRSTRRVALTAVGEALLPAARAAIDGFDRMRSLAAEDAAGLRGRVRVGTFSALDLVDLPGALGVYRRRHPLVDLLLRTSATGSTGLAEDLRRARLDVALLALPAAELADLAVTTLVRSGYVLLVESTDPLAGATRPTPAGPRGTDLRRHSRRIRQPGRGRPRLPLRGRRAESRHRGGRSAGHPALRAVRTRTGGRAPGRHRPARGRDGDRPRMAGARWELSVCTGPRPSAAVQALVALLEERMTV